MEWHFKLRRFGISIFSVWCNLAALVISLYSLADFRNLIRVKKRNKKFDEVEDEGSSEKRVIEELEPTQYLYAAVRIFTDIFKLVLTLIRYLVCWKGVLIKCFISTRRDGGRKGRSSRGGRSSRATLAE